MNCSPPGSSVPGILQARILAWVATPSSRNLPNPGAEPTSLMSPALGTTWGVQFQPYTTLYLVTHYGAFQWALVVKNPPANTGDVRSTGSIPGLVTSPGVGNGNHSSILSWETPWTERSLMGYTVHVITKSQTQLSTHANIHHGLSASRKACDMKKFLCYYLLMCTQNLN